MLAQRIVVFLDISLPLTKKTEGLLDYKMLKIAKPGLHFINISRGEVSPLKDLKKLLHEDVLGGLSLDVYPNEAKLAHAMRTETSGKTADLKIIQELSKKDQVLFTPHNAFNTQEALEQKASLSAEAVVNFLKKGKFPNSAPQTQ